MSQYPAPEIKEAKKFAMDFGMKAIVYGPAGSGKTPICSQLKDALLLISEPGMKSMGKSDTPATAAFSEEPLEKFFNWWFNSDEPKKKYRGLVWDSPSQAAETIVEHHINGKSKGGNKKHGLEAHGLMGNKMMEWMGKLFFQPQKHIILICKQEVVEINGMNYVRPYFPGKMLPVRAPHLFDLITRLGVYNVPGEAAPTRAFRTTEDLMQMGRDRSGNLNEFERPDINQLVQKYMK